MNLKLEWFIKEINLELLSISTSNRMVSSEINDKFEEL